MDRQRDGREPARWIGRARSGKIADVLSRKGRRQLPTKPSKELVVVPNPHPDTVYDVEMNCPEFTTLCPMTGQPDFATISIHYQPKNHIVELKSLKLYLWSFRDEGHFHEDVTNIILNDFVNAAKPRYAKVTGDFWVRGGIATKVTVEYRDPETKA
ncbi:NADPH-dependent 7-cyano-7-deazaguanine reductase QueF [Alicyclobacillus cycloheptanicus]|nr:NADPH-dependent 7-cyano-7-deazaguanine reductase QueF [Alicyclobacillus cycloheptanicus]